MLRALEQAEQDAVFWKSLSDNWKAKAHEYQDADREKLLMIGLLLKALGGRFVVQPNVWEAFSPSSVSFERTDLPTGEVVFQLIERPKP